MSLSLATHSPYILNYLNLLIQRQLHNAEGVKLGADKISAYEICAGTSSNLKIEVEANRPIVNAVSMSEPLSDIYAEYNRLAKPE
jgi:hypothetical protein